MNPEQPNSTLQHTNINTTHTNSSMPGITPDTFKQAMRQFATGVAIASCMHQGKAYGLTINSFTSLSLNPPLILWCLSKKSTQALYFEACSHFGISILAGHQEYLALRFASQGIDRFDGVNTLANSAQNKHQAPHGSPLLTDAVAQLECRVKSRYDEGDHWLYVGEVIFCQSKDGPSLLYHNKQFFAHTSHYLNDLNQPDINSNQSTAPANPMPFYERLQLAWQKTQSMLCIGLDPDPRRIATCANKTGAALLEAIYTFCKEIIRTTAPFCCAYKPQIAYFSAIGAETILERLIQDIRDIAPHALIILDAKRGDIGPTAAQYAREAFVRYQTDAVTVNPYMGSDSIEPYLDFPQCGVFLLCRTSNPGSGLVQLHPNNDAINFYVTSSNNTMQSPQPLYQTIAQWAAGPWNPHQQIGLVVGATQPKELALLRQEHPNLPFLVPGIGAQGGDLTQTIQAGISPGGFGLIINASRAILYASTGPDYAAAAAQEAQNIHSSIQKAAKQAREKKSPPSVKS